MNIVIAFHTFIQKYVSWNIYNGPKFLSNVFFRTKARFFDLIYLCEVYNWKTQNPIILNIFNSIFEHKFFTKSLYFFFINSIKFLSFTFYFFISLSLSLHLFISLLFSPSFLSWWQSIFNFLQYFVYSNVSRPNIQ